jgi:hypothetical protein
MSAHVAATPPTSVMTCSSVHSITSSAVASSPGGMVSPRAFAAVRLTAVSYLVGACTGRSADFAPRRIRSRYDAAITLAARHHLPAVYPSGSSSAYGNSTPTPRIRSGCCARARTDHATVTPTSAMKSRRLDERFPSTFGGRGSKFTINRKGFWRDRRGSQARSLLRGTEGALN